MIGEVSLSEEQRRPKPLNPQKRLGAALPLSGSCTVQKGYMILTPLQRVLSVQREEKVE